MSRARASLRGLGLAVAGLVSLSALVACEEDKEKAPVTTVKDSAPPAMTATATAAPATAASAPAKKTITCAPGPDVDFHGNAALEAEVRKKLGKDAGTVKTSDLKAIKSINLTAGSVDALDPCVFPLLTGMKDLFLGPGELDDLSPIAGLTQLVSLRASINKVSDLRPLEKMTQLDRLDLGRTSVRDVTPLAGLVALTELQLDDTQVSDISPLRTLKNLERLSIRHTPVKDISPLKDAKKLRFLYIEGAPIEDTNALSGNAGLKLVRKGT